MRKRETLLPGGFSWFFWKDSGPGREFVWGCEDREQKSRFSGEAGTGVCCLLMSFTLVSVAQSSGHAYMTVSWVPLFASPEMQPVELNSLFL